MCRHLSDSGLSGVHDPLSQCGLLLPIVRVDRDRRQQGCDRYKSMCCTWRFLPVQGIISGLGRELGPASGSLVPIKDVIQVN